MNREELIMQAVQESKTYWNDIFICYSEEDDLFTDKLARFLKRYKTPAELRDQYDRKLKVVKDELSLSGTAYEEFLEEQLQHSRKLMVICSPAGRRSKVVNEKIQRFAEHHGAENIIPIIIEGLPNDLLKEKNDAEKAYPEALCQAINKPNANDYNGFDIRTDKFHKGAYEKPWYTLLSQIYDVERTRMAQLDRNQRFHEKRRTFLTAFSVILLAVFVYSYRSWQQNAAENVSLKNSFAQLSGDLWEKSRLARSENNFLLSLHLAARAVSMNPDEVTRNSLLAEMQAIEPATRLDFIIKHRGEILGARFNEDQTRILTWSNDSTARLWDATNGQPLLPPLKHNGWVYGALFTSNESKILTWGTDSTIRVWETASGKPAGPALRHSAAVVGVMVNRDESRALSRCIDFSLRIWNLNSGRPEVTVTQHTGWINGACFNRDETQFLTWSDDSTARRWDAFNSNSLGVPMRHKGAINGLIFNEENARVITWSNDSTARLWDFNSGKLIGTSLEHDGEIIGARLNRAQNRLLTWGRDNSAYLWDIANGKTLFRPFQHDSWILGAAFNHDETRILTWSQDNTARLWDAQTGEPVGPPMAHSSGPMGDDAAVFGAAFSKEETHILTWGDDNTARIWEIATGRQSGPALYHDHNPGQNHEVKGAIFNPELTCIFTWSNDSTARFWRTTALLPAVNNAKSGGDRDFPQDKFTLEIMALTGTEYVQSTGKVDCIEPERWQKINREYLKTAREHYRDCRYPRNNFWRKFFTEEAERIRPLKK
jgi:WD40 repeat protein